MKYYIGILVLFLALPAFSETVEFSEDELPTETVLPVFDRTSVVKNRVVKLKKRFEVGAGLGLIMTEALYNNYIFNLSGAYHFDEVHGINLAATFMGQGLSGMGEDLKAGKIQGSPLAFDASRAPSPQYSLFANYQATAYYGKISLTKQSVMNLSLYGLAGLGVVSFGDSTSMGMDFGFGQKLYFSKDLALRFDMRILVYPGPDPTSPKKTPPTLPPGPALESSDFDTTTYFHTHLTLGLVYLL